MKNNQLKSKNNLQRFLIHTISMLVLIAAASPVALSADGDLDTSFGATGKVVTNTTLDEALNRIAVQSDDKIVAAGTETNGSTGMQSCLIVRYAANGAIDATFAANGKFAMTFGNQACQLYDVAVQADGKIVAAGVSSNKFLIVRLNQNGSLDTTFNGTGFNDAITGTGNALEIEPQTGKIVVGGAVTVISGGFRIDFQILRLNPNGTLDTTFDGDGVATTRIGEANFLSQIGIDDLKFQADGKIVAVGTTATANVSENFTVVRYNTNGSLDTTFNGSGFVVTTYAGNNKSRATAVAVQADGKIVVIGDNDASASAGRFFTIVRYNANGALDANFGSGGFVLAPQVSTFGSDVLIQTDGKILAVARATVNGQDDFYVLRLTPQNGAPDLTFGSNGGVTTNFTGRDEAKSIALQSNGKIIVGGFTYNLQPGPNIQLDFALARYQNSIAAPQRNDFLNGDFDGDGRTDFSVFRSGTWFINASGSPSFAASPQAAYAVQFGAASDKLTPADFDGDGKTDIAVWREGALAYFYILNSSNNTFRAEQFGRTGDNPLVVGNWDADNKADLAVYRSGANAGGQSLFFYRPSSQPTIDFETIYWGTTGDEAARGDFDGDGKLDAAVFRASNGIWYVRQSSNNQARYAQWGAATDKRVSGDFDGDGKTDMAIFRDGLWAILQSSNNGQRYERFGQAGDRIVAGDYDGDGKTDIAVWRNGVYYIKQSASSQSSAQIYGAASDVPVASAFVQ
jgi:uncharacterized delta-60 repeat protein